MNTIRRRAFCGCACAAALLSPSLVHAQQQAGPTSASPPDPALVEDLVAANRILFDQGVVDGFGHISARHDKNPNRFLLSRSMAPGLVTAGDIMEFDWTACPLMRRAGPSIWNASSTARSTGCSRR